MYSEDEKTEVFTDHLQRIFSGVQTDEDDKATEAEVSDCMEELLSVTGDIIQSTDLTEIRAINPAHKNKKAPGPETITVLVFKKLPD